MHTYIQIYIQYDTTQYFTLHCIALHTMHTYIHTYTHRDVCMYVSIHPSICLFAYVYKDIHIHIIPHLWFNLNHQFTYEISKEDP